MAVVSAAAIAVALPPSSLFLRRPSALASKPFLFSPARASSAPRSAVLAVPAPHPSLHRLKSSLAAAAAAESEAREIKVEVGNGGGEGVEEPDRGAGGGGGGGEGKSGGGGGGGGDSKESEEGGSDKEKKKGEQMGGMSMSQKLTLGYAALVGVGGVLGYVKSGSQKSLAAGGTAAFLLYYVYTQLPVRPAFASFLGLGLSAVLLVVMGSRFKKSGKIFPAGVISLVSLIMTGGYFHGILRSSHV